MACAVLCAGPAGRSLRAQAGSEQHLDPLRTTTASLVRELSNLIAIEASTYARSGKFELSNWREPTDSLVTLQVIEAGATGWSAIAVRRSDPGVRCAVVVGSAAPLFNAPPGPERPYCVAEDGSLLPPSGATPDSTWVFWWQDDVLDAPPQQLSCPSLKIPKLPKRNDSVYVAFVVGVDGLVEPGGIEIESTGALDASVAALMRLRGCTFRPATFRGVAVRGMMRHRIGLAPREPEAPPPQEVAPIQATRPTRALEAMRRALTDLTSAQGKHHDGTGVYSPDAAVLAGRAARDPAVHVEMLSWGARGWSAVAFHDSTGSRCVAAVGDSVPAPALPALGRGPRCTEPEGGAFVDSLTEADVAAVVPPQRGSCNTHLQFRRDPMRRVEVTLEFVVGVDGKPEPRSLRVLDGTGLEDDAGAVQILAGCRYKPATLHGAPIRVVVRQPVAFNIRPPD